MPEPAIINNRIKKTSLIKIRRRLSFLAFFSAMSPLGYYFSMALSNGGIGNLQQYFNRIMGVVIGIFLHISTTILFESSSDHKFTIRKLTAVLLGIGIALVAFLAEM